MKLNELVLNFCWFKDRRRGRAGSETGRGVQLQHEVSSSCKGFSERVTHRPLGQQRDGFNKEFGLRQLRAEQTEQRSHPYRRCFARWRLCLPKTRWRGRRGQRRRPHTPGPAHPLAGRWPRWSGHWEGKKQRKVTAEWEQIAGKHNSPIDFYHWLWNLEISHYSNKRAITLA